MIEADNLVQNLLGAVRGDQTPAIDVGEVKGYTEGKQKKHLTTLNYGQTPLPADTAPGMTVEVEKDNGATLNNKPIASPFAWQNCGLIVPVYPGMRALLGHNLDLTNDAVVVGFLWSEVDGAKHEPPKNEPGDYWLCLPTELDGNQQPKGSGVNDLTDKSGRRVIQAKGLQIFVGDGQLPKVGDRPAVPSAQTIEIKHESGTKILIDKDGKLTISSQKSKSAIEMSDSGVTIKADTISLAGSNGVSINSGKDSGVNIMTGDNGLYINTGNNSGVTIVTGTSGVNIR